MKVIAAMGVFLAFGAAIAAGLVMTLSAQGNPWLLVASLGLFTLLFVRVGCTEH